MGMEAYEGLTYKYDLPAVEKEISERAKKIRPLFVSIPCTVCWEPVVFSILKTEAGKLGQCFHCGHIYSHIRMSEEGLMLFYEKFLPGFLINQEIRDEDWIRRPILNNGVMDVIEEHAEIGNILDIGACAGDLLVFARDRGWQVAGQELSDLCINIMQYLDIPTVHGFTHETTYANESMDAIVLRHTLEHSPYPRLDLVVLKQVLKPEGVLYIEVPRWIGDGTDVPNLPQHISHFTESTLDLLLYIAGYEVVMMDRMGGIKEDDIDSNIRVIARPGR
jgi:SAM-dependent methyltransferase